MIYDPALDPFWTDAALLMTTIESPGPAVMSAMAEATGVIVAKLSPGEGWRKTRSFHGDRRRYYVNLFEWRK